MLKSMRVIHPEFELWRDFHYEYEPEHRRPIDVINESWARQASFSFLAMVPDPVDQFGF